MAEFKSVCAHVLDDKTQELPWDQELLRLLLFRLMPNGALKDLIRQLETNPSFKGTSSVLWSLLRLYTGTRDADKAFKTFANELTPACSQR